MPTFLTLTSGSAAEQAAHGASGTVPHVILVGISGAGKSSAGRAAAALLGRPFLDLDAEIERREHATVGELFASRGEPWFREQERALTEELRKEEGFLLSPGGGWVTNPGCVELLCPPAERIYLKVRPEAALARMSGELTSRPLLQRPDPLAELRRILTAREPLYLQSNHTVSTELMSLDQVVQRIVALAGRSRPD